MTTREKIRQVELLNTSTPEGIIIDSDTILADLLSNVDNEISGFSQDIFNIYKRSKDKDAVKQMFFEFTDMPDKVYMVNHFTRKNGTEDSKATAICSIGEAKEIGKLLIEIK